MEDDAVDIRQLAAVSSGLCLTFILLWIGPLWATPLLALLLVGIAARWPVWAVAVTPLTFPFTFQPRQFTGGRELTPAEVALLVLLVAQAVRLSIMWAAGRGRPRLDWLQSQQRPAGWAWGLALAVLVVATLSLGLVAEPAHRQQSLVEYRKVIVQPLIFAILAWSTLRRPADLHLAMGALLVSGAMVSLGALRDWLIGAAGISAEGVRRATGVFLHPDNLALFLGRATAAGIGLSLVRPRPVSLVLTAVSGLGLIVTFSRGGWLALFITAIGLAWLLGRRRLALAGLALVLLLLAALPLTGIERFSSLFDLGGGSAALRLTLWRSTLAMLADYPVTGVGLDQFLYLYQSRYIAPEGWAERFSAHPHNLVLDFWVRLGILGLAVGVALHILPLLKGLWAIQRPDGTIRALVAGASGILAYSLFHGQVDNSFFLPDLALTFWLAMVVLARLTGRPTDLTSPPIQLDGPAAGLR